jgi:FixJ family two-component response regulator
MTSSKQIIVAVIDDDGGMREAAERILGAYGYGTETFHSAEAFLGTVATSKAVCLVVDIQLGNISGLELARQLTADGYKFPIVFMTGNNNETIRSGAAAAGGIAFLEKPFPAKMLVDAVRMAIR